MEIRADTAVTLHVGEQKRCHMKMVRTVITALTAIVLSTSAFAQTDNNQAAAQGIGILSWIVIGLIAGYLASRVVNKTGEGLFRDIILGIVGAFIGGMIVRMFGGIGVTGLNIWSIFVAFIGAVLLLVVYHAIRGQKRTI
jgi:uncharacterized membrane protein YeaQ/YmgE (transglycosylase-associated protein family)